MPNLTEISKDRREKLHKSELKRFLTNGLYTHEFSTLLPETQEVIVFMDPDRISNFNDVDDERVELYKIALQRDGLTIRKVKESYLNNELYLIAVKNNGNALRYIENQIPEVCLAAVQQNESTLRYVKDLNSIADELDESIIVKGLNSDYEDAVLAYQKLVKIREAHQIAERINEAESPSATPFNKKAKM